jgi:hypothetical protein
LTPDDSKLTPQDSELMSIWGGHVRGDMREGGGKCQEHASTDRERETLKEENARESRQGR